MKEKVIFYTKRPLKKDEKDIAGSLIQEHSCLISAYNNFPSSPNKNLVYSLLRTTFNIERLLKENFGIECISSKEFDSKRSDQVEYETTKK